MIDGHPCPARELPENYGVTMPPTVVPANTYFVLADNPSDSNSDSRSLGPIHANCIKGYVRGIAAPRSRSRAI